MSKGVVIFGWDGATWREILIDAAGRLQIDIVSSGLPTGGATEATLATLATETKLEAVRALLASIAGIDFSTQTTLAALLTDLQAKADLTETQPVSAATLPLPTGAATAAHQVTMITALQLIDDLRTALSSIADDSLDVRLDGQTADVEVTQTTPADLTPGIEGWDGAAWRKLPLLWGYSDRYTELKSDVGVPAGDVDQLFSPVPEGEIWIVTSFAAYSGQANVTAVSMEAMCGGNYLVLARDPYTVANKHIAPFTPIILKEDDRLRVYWYAAAVGDSVVASANGYKMKIAE